MMTAVAVAAAVGRATAALRSPPLSGLALAPSSRTTVWSRRSLCVVRAPQCGEGRRHPAAVPSSSSAAHLLGLPCSLLPPPVFSHSPSFLSTLVSRTGGSGARPLSGTVGGSGRACEWHGSSGSRSSLALLSTYAGHSVSGLRGAADEEWLDIDEVWVRFRLSEGLLETYDVPVILRAGTKERGALFRKSDVHAAALLHYGSQRNLEAVIHDNPSPTFGPGARRRAQLRTSLRESGLSSSSYLGAWVERHRRRLLEASERSSRESGSGTASAVHLAVGGNALVTVAKFGAFAMSGSGSLLAEAIHSFVDVLNQSLLAFGISRSKKEPDSLHPYGYGRETYLWALISALSVFFLGCGVSVYHGVDLLIHPPTEIHSTTEALGVLGLSFAVESATLWYAYRVCRAAASAQEMSLWDYVRRGPDPMGVAVLVEDGAAVLGCGVAAACLAVSTVTGDPAWDAYGAIAVGGVLGTVAIFLARKNGELLLGRAMPDSKKNAILAILTQDPVISSVHDVKAVIISTDSARFKAEIAFDGREIARKELNDASVGIASLAHDIDARGVTKEELEDVLMTFGEACIARTASEVNRIEATISKAFPEVKHVDLESS